MLDDIEHNPGRLSDRLDWAAKLDLFERYIDRDGLSWEDSKLAALDLQYHDVDPARGLYHRLVSRGGMRRIFNDVEISFAETNPPEETRAYFRGRCVTQFPDSLVAANWDSLVFDLGEPHLRRVPMLEPLRGGRELVGPILDEVEDAAELIRRLGD